MCTCGCADYIKQGQEAILKRAMEIVRRLGLTAENAQLFEEAESICSILGPKVSTEAADVWDVVLTLHRFHEGIAREKRQKATEVAREVFHNLPTRGDTKEVLTLYQQLEQLHRQLNDKMIDSLNEPTLSAALRAMRTVHQGNEERKAKLIQRYNLSLT